MAREVEFLEHIGEVSIETFPIAAFHTAFHTNDPEGEGWAPTQCSSGMEGSGPDLHRVEDLYFLISAEVNKPHDLLLFFF